MTIPQAEASLQPLWHALRAQELTLYKNHSERFKKNFLDNSQLQVKDDSRGFSPGRLDLKTPAHPPDEHGWPAHRHVRHQRGDPPAPACLRPCPRDVHALCAWRHSLPRIISQLFVEGGILGLTGAIAGLALAPFVANALVHLMIHADPGSEAYSATIDARVLVFTIAISILVSLLFSLAPVLHFMNPNLATALRQSTGTASKASQRFRKFAVGVQISLSVLLLGGAGLFVHTLDNLPSSTRRLRHHPSRNLQSRSQQLRLRRRPHPAGHHQRTECRQPYSGRLLRGGHHRRRTHRRLQHHELHRRRPQGRRRRKIQLRSSLDHSRVLRHTPPASPRRT